MKQRMEQAQAKLRQMDQELQQRLEAMDNAQGQAKVDAMAEAIRTLITQRKEMNEQRAEMMQEMMQHMGQHMMMCPPDGQGRQTMTKCPMMQRRGPATQRPRQRSGRTMPAQPDVQTNE